MKTKIYSFILFSALLFCTAAVGQKKVLYVYGGAVMGKVDTLLTVYLTSEGYKVSELAAATFKANFTVATAYDTIDAVYFSETVGSGDVIPFATAGYPKPCVTTEGWAPKSDRWGWVTDNAIEWKQLSSLDVNEDVKILVIDNANHYITNIYSDGDEVAWTLDENISNLGVCGFMLDVTMDDVVKLGTFKNAAMQDFPTLWAIPIGAKVISSNLVIPVRMVAFGVINTGLDFPSNDFNKIIDRSLEWVLGANLNTLNETGAVHNDLVIMPNPARELVKISFTLNNPGKVQVNIYDITGKIVESVKSGNLNAGPNTIEFDSFNKAAGQYIISVITANEVLTGKVVSE